MGGGLKNVSCNSHFSVSVIVLSCLTPQRRDVVKLSRSAAYELYYFEGKSGSTQFGAHSRRSLNSMMAIDCFE